MVGISFVRILRAAFQNFWRNIWLSIATMIIMTITLLMVSFVYFANVFGAEVLRNIEQKVDLSVTFKNSTTEEQIQTIATDLESRQDVESLTIITSEEALQSFRQRHADDPFIEESLQELEENPLPASVTLVATDPRFYQNIAAQLESEKYAPFIEEINLEDLRPVIDRLTQIMATVRNSALAVTAAFIFLVVLIMFNTVRLAIYSFREEIDIMRLVGASNWFIRGPFVFEAIFVSLLAVCFSSALLYPIIATISPELRGFFVNEAGSFDLAVYAQQNWLTVISLQVAVAVGLATLSSWIAIRRYLRS